MGDFFNVHRCFTVRYGGISITCVCVRARARVNLVSTRVGWEDPMLSEDDLFGNVPFQNRSSSDNLYLDNFITIVKNLSSARPRSGPESQKSAFILYGQIGFATMGPRRSSNFTFL